MQGCAIGGGDVRCPQLVSCLGIHSGGELDANMVQQHHLSRTVQRKAAHNVTSVALSCVVGFIQITELMTKERRLDHTTSLALP